MKVLQLHAVVGICVFLEASHAFQPCIRQKEASSCITRQIFRLLAASNEEHERTTMTTNGTTTSHTVTVSYEDSSTTISVNQDETILAALERHHISDRLGLPSNMVPSDCRRGNCLTCTGSHASPASFNSNSIVTEDGLSPHMSNWMRDKGFVVTCSSKVVGDGLELRLGANADAWEEAYLTRLEDEHAKRIGWAAMARTKRKSDEKNVPRWKKETEGVLRNNDGNSSSEA